MSMGRPMGEESGGGAEILSSHKKREILPFVTSRMDLEGIMINEISQTDKETYHTLPLT